MYLMEISVKRCPQCAETKPHSEFHRNTRAKDNCAAYCRSCTKVRVARKKTERDAYNRSYYAANRDRIREAAQIYGKTYRVNHADRHAEKNKKWREANRERRSQVNAAWKARNRDKVCDYSADRRARSKSTYIEHVDRQVIWDRDNGICHICKLPADPARWHLEHIIPLSRGGEHSYANTAVSHPACNLAKGARLP